VAEHRLGRSPLVNPVSEGAVVSAVEVVDLVKLFSRREGKRRSRIRAPALDGVTLSVARGQSVAILGQNGSGKSTLVRVLATLLLHESGQARVFGHDVAREERAVRRLVNRVSVEASFFKRLSAAENLHYSARFYGLTPARTRVRVPEILAAVGFPAKRSREPMEELSRGMQQKVALARALLTAPTLLLLDEPTTGLDPRSKLEVQAFVTQMRAEHDTTTLLCTHDMAEAETLADRVGILDRGRLLALAPPAELRRRYGAGSLEDAFLAATGKSFDDEEPEGLR
jgi:ABC-2 type transport system ATP-binding protein